jgi:hypothetical protein
MPTNIPSRKVAGRISVAKNCPQNSFPQNLLRKKNIPFKKLSIKIRNFAGRNSLAPKKKIPLKIPSRKIAGTILIPQPSLAKNKKYRTILATESNSSLNASLIQLNSRSQKRTNHLIPEPGSGFPLLRGYST